MVQFITAADTFECLLLFVVVVVVVVVIVFVVVVFIVIVFEVVAQFIQSC